MTEATTSAFPTINAVYGYFLTAVGSHKRLSEVRLQDRPL